MTIHPILTKLQSENLGVQVLAYLDDVFIVEPPNPVLSALESLRKQFSLLQLQISDSKCEIYSRNSVSDDVRAVPTTIPISQDGTMTLGIPIGNPRFIEKSTYEPANAGNILCNKLTQLDDIQSAMLLLRFCHVPRINHLV